MKRLLTRSVVGLAALAVPASAALALPAAAGAATVPATTHVVSNCMAATGAAAQYPQYPNGCSFVFFDGNAHWATFHASTYTDVVTPSGNETEVITGVGANSVPNNTGKVVVYDSTNTPNNPNQTALSFVSGKTTTNWIMAILPNGEWGLIANFS
jgi:hypothetical protein